MTKVRPSTHMVVFGIGDGLWSPVDRFERGDPQGVSIALDLLCIQVARRCTVIFIASITGAG